MTDVIVHDLNESGIYEIVNLKNGKRYVGSASNFALRWKRHRQELSAGRHHSRHLQFAWDKNGAGVLTFRILFTCPKLDLIECEQLLIDMLEPQYNMSKVAGSIAGMVMSDEVREKVRQAKTGLRHSEESKQRMREAKLGKKMSAETRAKMSASGKGRPKTDDFKAKLSAILKGRTPSPESIAKRKATLAAKKATQKKEAMV